MKNKIAPQTIIRTIVLVITLINQTLTLLGKNPLPFAEEEMYEILTTIATLVITTWAWWKNNSFTSAAIEADKYMKAIKESEE